jgi:hypothetical protein
MIKKYLKEVLSLIKESKYQYEIAVLVFIISLLLAFCFLIKANGLLGIILLSIAGLSSIPIFSEFINK